MSFIRTNEFEHVVNENKGEIQDSFEKRLLVAYPNNKDELNSIMMLDTNDKSQKDLVAMVESLMKRTGLKSTDDVRVGNRKSTKKHAQEIKSASFVDLPEVQKLVEKYITINKTYQIAPVLEVVRKFVEELQLRRELPANLVDMDVGHDGKLIAFISDHILTNKPDLDNIVPTGDVGVRTETDPAFENLEPNRD